MNICWLLLLMSFHITASDETVSQTVSLLNCGNTVLYAQSLNDNQELYAGWRYIGSKKDQHGAYIISRVPGDFTEDTYTGNAAQDFAQLERLYIQQKMVSRVSSDNEISYFTGWHESRTLYASLFPRKSGKDRYNAYTYKESCSEPHKDIGAYWGDHQECFENLLKLFREQEEGIAPGTYYSPESRITRVTYQVPGHAKGSARAIEYVTGYYEGVLRAGCIPQQSGPVTYYAYVCSKSSDLTRPYQGNVAECFNTLDYYYKNRQQ